MNLKDLEKEENVNNLKEDKKDTFVETTFEVLGDIGKVMIETAGNCATAVSDCSCCVVEGIMG